MEYRTNTIADNQFFASGNASLIPLPGIVQVRSHGNTHFENENISALDIVLFRRIYRCTCFLRQYAGWHQTEGAEHQCPFAFHRIMSPVRQIREKWVFSVIFHFSFFIFQEQEKWILCKLNKPNGCFKKNPFLFEYLHKPSTVFWHWKTPVFHNRWLAPGFRIWYQLIFWIKILVFSRTWPTTRIKKQANIRFASMLIQAHKALHRVGIVC